jgi:hypothetical protein
MRLRPLATRAASPGPGPEGRSRRGGFGEVESGRPISCEHCQRCSYSGSSSERSRDSRGTITAARTRAVQRLERLRSLSSPARSTTPGRTPRSRHVRCHSQARKRPLARFNQLRTKRGVVRHLLRCVRHRRLYRASRVNPPTVHHR